MSIISRNSLKSKFVSGTAATQSKFDDLFDSSYNKTDDSILLGPVGITGLYGALGPTGGTFNSMIGPSGATFYEGLKGPQTGTFPFGLWVSTASVPGATSSAGVTGQTIFQISGATANMYVHTGSQWIKFSGDSSF
jgi:hypothetical protein